MPAHEVQFPVPASRLQAMSRQIEEAEQLRQTADGQDDILIGITRRATRSLRTADPKDYQKALGDIIDAAHGENLDELMEQAEPFPPREHCVPISPRNTPSDTSSKSPRPDLHAAEGSFNRYGSEGPNASAAQL